MDLDAIDAAEKAMTPGPWRDGQYARPTFETQVFCDHLEVTVAGCAIEQDATGIALLRNSAPEMIRRIREQEAEIAELRALCGKAEKRIANRHDHDGLKYDLRAASNRKAVSRD